MVAAVLYRSPATLKANMRSERSLFPSGGVTRIVLNRKSGLVPRVHSARRFSFVSDFRLSSRLNPQVVPAEVPRSLLLSLDYRRGGGLLFLGAVPGVLPQDLGSAGQEESLLPMLRAATGAGASAVALTPFAWDLPLWIASNKLDYRCSNLTAAVGSWYAR